MSGTARFPAITRRPIPVRCRACHRVVSGYLELEDGQDTRRARPFPHERGNLAGMCGGAHRHALAMPEEAALVEAPAKAPEPVQQLASRAGWRWFGYGGHFVGSSRCAFHLTTLVGGILISTIGGYRPKHSDAVVEIGSGRTFETMVFRCAGVDAHGNPENDLESIEATSYNDSLQAERGHYAMCERWHQRQLQ